MFAAMDTLSSHIATLPEERDRRERTKERVYVLFQSCGWLGFIGMQLGFSIALSAEPTSQYGRSFNAGISIFPWLLAWLITHFTRRVIPRSQWKQLGWRGLLPRILGVSVVQSVVWVTVVFGYLYLVLRGDWPARLPLPIVIMANWVYGGVMFAVWLCLYFFYHLFDRFNRSEIERAQLAAAVKEAELRSLKSQINPHFIFNSLNSLRGLIDEDPARARLSVTQLANLLRYSLQSSQLETVPFEDELRVVNDYLALEQVRHEERLRIRLDIAPETLQLPIPPMLLQTLVENAVKYGISTRSDGGEIAIVARRENGTLRLQVVNPGSLPQRAFNPASNASTGLGLKNAGERLRLLFGERASLRLRAGELDRVVAEAVIPLPSA
jgi:hypothetical protein